jgi:hypothetical protein
MEKTIKIVLGIVFTVILVFFWAWAAAHSWNLIMPDLYGVPRVTMLQAYVGSTLVAVLTFKATKADQDYTFSLVTGFMRCILVVIFAYIVRYGFM